GCGCSAAVLTTMVLPGLQSGRWKRVLFCPTGALLSPVSTMQGESIPGICHAIVLEGGAS
ncbi:stage V sporulation protein AD, partial [Faecalicatena contorta]|nr:stage V sporulation protein AD [Faecalicatena contorta]